MRSLRDSAEDIRDFDVAWFMVSLDEPDRNKAFADSLGANFVLLSDPVKESAQNYGVLASSGSYAKRWTFYIDQNGIVKKIDKNVQPSTHGKKVVETLSKLNFPKKNAADRSE
ncbi:MAG: hypothetical protein CL917_07345 [Deltaproteobacteria bacterium]|nr:hypothetical protein [Deltaproteobacteria bacterium]